MMSILVEKDEARMKLDTTYLTIRCILSCVNMALVEINCTVSSIR